MISVVIFWSKQGNTQRVRVNKLRNLGPALGLTRGKRTPPHMAIPRIAVCSAVTKFCRRVPGIDWCCEGNPNSILDERWSMQYTMRHIQSKHDAERFGSFETHPYVNGKNNSRLLRRRPKFAEFVAGTISNLGFWNYEYILYRIHKFNIFLYSFKGASDNSRLNS